VAAALLHDGRKEGGKEEGTHMQREREKERDKVKGNYVKATMNAREHIWTKKM
jgi:hypothetical protein